MNLVFPSCPQYGQNSLGLATRKNEKSTPVRIKFIAPGQILYCRSVENQEPVIVHQQDFTPMPSIPSKFREYNFLAVASFWAQALHSFPKAIIVKANNISPETFVRKLRESRVAKDTYGWTSPLVDETLWMRHSNEILISPLLNGTVQMGPVTPKEVVIAANITHTSDVFVQWTNQNALETFCEFVSMRVLNPKPVFVVQGLTNALIADLESRYDLGFTPREDGTTWEVIF